MHQQLLELDGGSVVTAAVQRLVEVCEVELLKELHDQLLTILGRRSHRRIDRRTVPVSIRWFFLC